MKPASELTNETLIASILYTVEEINMAWEGDKHIFPTADREQEHIRFWQQRQRELKAEILRRMGGDE